MAFFGQLNNFARRKVFSMTKTNSIEKCKKHVHFMSTKCTFPGPFHVSFRFYEAKKCTFYSHKMYFFFVNFMFLFTFLCKICKILQHRFCQIFYPDMVLNGLKSSDIPRLMHHAQHI